MADNPWSWKKKRPTKVFYSVAAQEDNLGDLIIRLRMLNWLRESGDAIVVYVGPMSDSYLESFSFDAQTILVKSKVDFIKILLGALLQHRVFIILPPGPKTLKGIRDMATNLATILVNVVVSAGGGGILQIGASFRQTEGVGRKFHKLKTSLFRVCVVRDVGSFVTQRAAIAPDIAFEDWRERCGAERFRLSISLRSDQNVDRQILSEYRKLAEENGWQLTFVSQVQRDDVIHQDLASEFNADLVSWRGSHANQLERVRKTYAESVSVLTDRLHALIFASNLGALPLALVHPSNDKLTSAFDHVLKIPLIESGTGTLDSSVSDLVQSHARNPEHLTRKLSDAYRRIDDINIMVQSALY